MINCVIFDMDGVVVNTEPLSYAANSKMYKSLGIDVPKEVYATFTGNSDKNIVAKLKDLYDIKLTHGELLEEKYKYYYAAFDSSEDLDLMPGVKNLIIDLHRQGIVLVLASSSSKVKIGKVFARFGLHPYFSHIVSGEDFENSKPDPAIFIEAAAKSGFPKEECIVIEDSTNGIKAAKAAGIYCVAYSSEHAMLQDTSLADEVITDFSLLNAEKIRNIV